MEKIKCFEISPSSDSRYDSMIVKDDGTWKPIKDAIEDLLENSFLESEDEGVPWKGVEIKVKCVEMTQEDFDTLSEE